MLSTVKLVNIATLQVSPQIKNTTWSERRLGDMYCDRRFPLLFEDCARSDFKFCSLRRLISVSQQGSEDWIYCHWCYVKRSWIEWRDCLVNCYFIKWSVQRGSHLKYVSFFFVQPLWENEREILIPLFSQYGLEFVKEILIKVVF